MADAVTNRTLFNGSRDIVIHVTNLSDGTGESGVVKIDKSTLVGPNGLEPSKLSVLSIRGEVAGMEVKLSFDRTSDVTIAQLAQGSIDLNFEGLHGGGLVDNGTGDTGDVLLTTAGHTTGDSYDLIIRCRKKD